MPRRASASARSLPGSPACPFTHTQRTSCGRIASTSLRHRSSFLTGFLAAVFQPLRCQPWIHLVIPSSRYLLSVCRSPWSAAAAPPAPGWPPSAPSGCSWSAARRRTSPFRCPASASPRPSRPAPGSRCTRRLCRSRPRSCGKATPCRRRFRHPARGVPLICFGRQEFIQ
jgi:hypothetical protein